MNFIDRYLKSKLVGHIGYDVWRPNEKKKYLRYIPNDVKTILDIGCGLGEFLWILQKNGYEIGGCDVDEACIERTRNIIKDVKYADVQRLSNYYSNNSFDLITCFHVLEHLSYPYETMLEIRKVTKKYAIFAVPNARYIAFNERDTHLFSWNRRTFTNIIESAGFNIILISEDWTNIIPEVLKLTPILSKILLRVFYDPFEIIALVRKNERGI